MVNSDKQKVSLIRKTSKSFLLISMVLMLASTVILYFYVKNLLASEGEEELYSTNTRITTAIEQGENLYVLPPIVEINKVASLHPDVLRDTLIFDPSQNEIELFQELSTFKEINNQVYQITVRSLVVETEDILIGISASYIIILLLSFLIFFYLNRRGNKKLWEPFFYNLNQMQSFSLESSSVFHPVESDVEEFSELNKQVSILMDKVKSDYENLKQYTEDVSHEIQTPIAIIQAKIENIVNESEISESAFEALTSIQRDIKRLTQLNKRLTLLAKIDNNQFINKEKVDITQLIEERIASFKELSSVPFKFSNIERIKVTMDPYLAELLCNNLISNAIKHGGEIKNRITITTKGNTLSIANYGKKKYENSEKLFSRFYKGKMSGRMSSGLGLAIVKKICDYYGFKVNYSFDNQNHKFHISFG